MRRKINLYIFIAIALSSVVVGSALTFYSKIQIEKLINNEESNLIRRVSDEYRYIITIVEMAEKQIYHEYKNPLENLANQLIPNNNSLDKIPIETLSDYAKSIGVDELFIIDSQGVIINSSLEAEIGYDLNNEGEVFMNYFNNLFVSNQFECQSFASSSVDGTLMFYTYYNPPNTNFVLESSLSLKKHLSKFYKKEFNELMVWGSRDKIINENPLVEGIEIFSLNDGAKVSIYDSSKPLKLNSTELQELIKNKSKSFKTKRGEEYYRLISIDSQDSNFPNNLIVYIEFNYTPLVDSFRQLILVNALLFFIVLFLVSIISLVIIKKHFIKKVEIINSNLELIKDAKYDSLQSFKSNDELSTISSNIIEVKNNVMLREQQLLEAKRKAEESDSLKSSFLANMSHEIRTPLNAIVGFSNLLVELFNKKDGVEDYTHLISENSTQLLRIISDIIDISRIESNQLLITEKKIDLNKIIETITIYGEQRIEIYRKLYDREKTDFRVKKSKLSGGNIIITDPFRLNQILEQLIDNAAKFTSSGEIILEYYNNEKMLTFSVIDTGSGIDTDNIDHIFNKFIQVEDFLSGKLGGTGIGLTICKGVLSILGGEISVKSKLGKGSTFTFSIPYSPVC